MPWLSFINPQEHLLLLPPVCICCILVNLTCCIFPGLEDSFVVIHNANPFIDSHGIAGFKVILTRLVLFKCFPAILHKPVHSPLQCFMLLSHVFFEFFGNPCPEHFKCSMPVCIAILNGNVKNLNMVIDQEPVCPWQYWTGTGPLALRLQLRRRRCSSRLATWKRLE